MYTIGTRLFRFPQSWTPKSQAPTHQSSNKEKFATGALFSVNLQSGRAEGNNYNYLLEYWKQDSVYRLYFKFDHFINGCSETNLYLIDLGSPTVINPWI